MRIINWDIIGHPVNWVTVTLMTIIGLFALNLLLTPWHAPQSTGLNANSIPTPDLSTLQ